MNKPELYIFAISHYCEKARWALDFHEIGHDVKFLAPGQNVAFAKKHGAPRSSVPILLADGQSVQGSARIVDWADEHSATKTTLTPADSADECRALEKRLDDIAGVHVRRYYYSEALCRYPERVRPIFTKDLGLGQKAMVAAGWGAMRKAMIRFMDLGDEQFDESRQVILGELDWLDGLLGDGRPFLVGDGFTRADLAAASLLSPLAAPTQHPSYSESIFPPKVKKDIAAWSDRPIIRWVRDLYAKFRR